MKISFQNLQGTLEDINYLQCDGIRYSVEYYLIKTARHLRILILLLSFYNNEKVPVKIDRCMMKVPTL